MEFIGQVPEDTTPQGQAVIFIVNKGGSEDGLYRSVNLSGLWVEDSKGMATRPIMEHVDHDGVEMGEQPQRWSAFVNELREELAAMRESDAA